MKDAPDKASLLGICFLSEVVESIMLGGERGLRRYEYVESHNYEWTALRQGENRKKWPIVENEALRGAKRASPQSVRYFI